MGALCPHTREEFMSRRPVWKGTRGWEVEKKEDEELEIGWRKKKE